MFVYWNRFDDLWKVQQVEVEVEMNMEEMPMEQKQKVKIYDYLSMLEYLVDVAYIEHYNLNTFLFIEKKNKIIQNYTEYNRRLHTLKFLEIMIEIVYVFCSSYRRVHTLIRETIVLYQLFS
jgi:hypothetical protein